MYLELIDVKKKIKDTIVLENINLNLEKGKIYGLKGKNGSGKTMLMRVISGLIYPSEGVVKVNDKILGKEISFPESIGILIENPSFLSNYTGFENLNMIASIKGEIDKQQIKKTLDSVGLDPEDTRKYKKYSLGMKQRLGIACAIMEKPELVILDEPTNALDEKGIQELRNILFLLKQKGSLVIITCHDTEELELLSDEIIEIKDGKII